MTKKQTNNWLERSVLMVATILVTGMLGFLVYMVFTEEETPPEIILVTGDTTFSNDHYIIEVLARNNGTQTAEDARIRVTLGSGQEMETAYLDFPYLPGRSRVRGWVIFEHDPAAGPLKFKVMGYREP